MTIKRKFSKEFEDIIKEKFGERMKRAVAEKAILDSIETKIEEDPNYYKFGSTDKKGYAIKCTSSYKHLIKKSYLDIQPFDCQEIIDAKIERLKQKNEYELFEVIYNELFK